MRKKGDGDTGEHNHRENGNQGNQSFIKNISLFAYRFLIYRNE